MKSGGTLEEPQGQVPSPHTLITIQDNEAMTKV